MLVLVVEGVQDVVVAVGQVHVQLVAVVNADDRRLLPAVVPVARQVFVKRLGLLVKRTSFYKNRLCPMTCGLG